MERYISELTKLFEKYAIPFNVKEFPTRFWLFGKEVDFNDPSRSMTHILLNCECSSNIDSQLIDHIICMTLKIMETFETRKFIIENPVTVDKFKKKGYTFRFSNMINNKFIEIKYLLNEDSFVELTPSEILEIKDQGYGIAQRSVKIKQKICSILVDGKHPNMCPLTHTFCWRPFKESLPLTFDLIDRLEYDMQWVNINDAYIQSDLKYFKRFWDSSNGPRGVRWIN